MLSSGDARKRTKCEAVPDFFARTDAAVKTTIDAPQAMWADAPRLEIVAHSFTRGPAIRLARRFRELRRWPRSSESVS
jgi:hypothetical protein